MPAHRQPRSSRIVSSTVWPSGGRHVWSSGGSSSVQSHDRGHLVYAATGVLTVRTAAGTSVVPANRVAWTPAGSTHQHRAHGDTDMRIVFLPPSVAARLPDRPAVFVTSGLAREVILALTDPHHHDGSADPHRPPARRRLERVLVDELTEPQEQPLYLPDPRDDRLQALARLMAEEPGSNASMAELGVRIGASSRTLSRLLRSELGMKFYEWRTQLRVYRALLLLADGYDVTQTAHACGWSNPSGFIAAFTTVIGSTPGRYQAGRPDTAGPDESVVRARAVKRGRRRTLRPLE